MNTLQNILIALILSNFTLLAQGPNEIKKVPEKGTFVQYVPDSNPTTLSAWNDLFREHEEYKDKTIPLVISLSFVNKVLEDKESYLDVQIPFFNDNQLELTLKRKDINTEGFQLIVRTENGSIKKQYNQGFLAYEIISYNNDINGVMIFSKSGLNAIIKNENNTYEISKLNFERLNDLSEDLYILSNISDNPNDNHFSCGVDQLDYQDTSIINNQNPGFRLGASLGCLNIAIEIDYSTRQTFLSAEEAVDWALAILTGVSLIYEDEVGLSIISDYAFVWEIEDPYTQYVDESSEMLYALKDRWNNDEVLINVERHMVHLFTKRTNTGTGGIAFVNGAGSSAYGFGYSSSLTSDMEYSDIPSPFYHWNLLCTAHELGHNLGSMHTQWCGWPGGPINNCVDLEESTPGECETFINNPTPEVGSIMSYCHTWSQNEGGGIMMKFDQLVQDVIITKAGFLNLIICDETVENIFGCMDEIACNFNELANQEDGSCTYEEQYYDCDGLCILDVDDDGVCDELDNCPDDWNPDQMDFNENDIGDRCEDFLPLEELEDLDVLMAYPNPTTGVVNITYNTNQAKNISVEVYNYIGDRIACGDPDIFGKDISRTLDLSKYAKGIYSIVVKTEDNIASKAIILK